MEVRQDISKMGLGGTIFIQVGHLHTTIVNSTSVLFLNKD